MGLGAGKWAGGNKQRFTPLYGGGGGSESLFASLGQKERYNRPFASYPLPLFQKRVQVHNFSYTYENEYMLL